MENKVMFDSVKYSIDEFVKYLEEKEIITLYYTFQSIYDIEEKMHRGKTYLEYIAFNQTYFDSLITDSVYSKFNRYLISINECAKLLDVTRQTVNNMIAGNKLQSYKIGTSVKLKYKDVIDYIESNKAK